MTFMKFMDISIVSNRKIGPDYYYLVLKSEQSLGRIIPGQFLMLGFPGRLDPLLPRPMGFFQVLEENSSSTLFSIGYIVAGKGTNLLSQYRAGEILKGTGPLGNGWDIEKIGSKVIMVAGGIGITPFYLPAKELIKSGEKVILLYGAKTTADLVFENEFRDLDIEIILYTEDGSTGTKGLVSEGLADYIEGDISVLACGPGGMLKKIAEICLSAGVDPQLSFDRRMACGFGVCLGCNIAVKDKDGKSVYVRVCKEGPVFKGSEVAW
jgi:dihydroorotate dehydrogenase electron transfer subunit